MTRASAFLAVFLVASAAHADEPRADPRARAQQLFDSALADAEAGNFAAACPKFLASQEADPKTSTLLNLANCYEKNGQTASAWGAFREAEGRARNANRKDWETVAHTRAEALEPKLVRLSVVVPPEASAPGMVVERDGVAIGPGEWAVAIPVDPGEHRVRATATGREPWESKVDVREATMTITVPPLERIPEPPPEPKLAPAPHWTPMRTAGVVTAGAGVAALAAGGIVALVAKGSYDDARALCTSGTSGCPASAVADADSAYGTASAATVLVIAGAVTLVTGAALYFLAPDAKARRVGLLTF